MAFEHVICFTDLFVTIALGASCVLHEFFCNYGIVSSVLFVASISLQSEGSAGGFLIQPISFPHGVGCWFWSLTVIFCCHSIATQIHVSHAPVKSKLWVLVPTVWLLSCLFKVLGSCRVSCRC